MNRKLFSIVLTLALVVVSSLFTLSFAGDNENISNQSIGGMGNTELALENSLSNEFEEFTPEKFDNWIELFDSNGVRYAYLVSLYDSVGQVKGFSVISDINDRVLMTATGENFAGLFTSIMEITQNQADEYQLIYEFPHGFYLENKSGISQIYLRGKTLSKNGIPTNNVDTVNFLKSQPEQRILATSTIYGSLNSWDIFEFVPVRLDGTNSYYYGGFQGWLTDEGVSSFYANRSCGVTAAANMMQYMSENISGMSNLYTRSNMYKSEFSKYQKDVYDYLSPAIWGIPGLNTLIDRVKDFASDQGVTLIENTASSIWNETNVRNYIAEGLNNERPVLLITWNSVIPDLEEHWVTVTRIYGSYGNTKMLTSNWGGKAEYDFSLWVSGSSLYKGVIYFD